MNQMAWRSLLRTTKGATALEFALVSGMLMALLFGCLEAGIMLWTRGTLQSVAAQTARCVAIGSPLCTTVNTYQSYAVGRATAWLGSPLISNSDVSAAMATKCGTVTGSLGYFEVVTITATPWVGAIIYPFGSRTEIVTACYPI